MAGDQGGLQSALPGLVSCDQAWVTDYWTICTRSPHDFAMSVSCNQLSSWLVCPHLEGYAIVLRPLTLRPSGAVPMMTRYGRNGPTVHAVVHDAVVLGDGMTRGSF